MRWTESIGHGRLEVQARGGRAVVDGDRFAEPRDVHELGLIDRVERGAAPEEERRGERT